VNPYEEQIDRAKRWYGRFQEITDGRKHDRSVEFARDEVFAFFQNCYHVKDWIIEDKAMTIEDRKRVVEQFITESESLCLCADLCNATKHLVLKTTRSHDSPEIARAHYGLNVSAGVLKVRFEISTDSGSIDAFDLATRCLSEWDRFFKLTPDDHAQLREGNRHRKAKCRP
jgi:hypothetical protein